MIQNIHPRSGFWIQILIFYPSRILDPGVKKAPDPVSATLEFCPIMLQIFHDKYLLVHYDSMTNIFWYIMQVVVDTLSPWDKDILTAALKECDYRVLLA
jgi:hypothetical protein